MKRRRPLSTSEAVTDAVTTARKPIPVEHHDRGDEPAGSLLWRDVAIPHGGDGLQREPKSPADRRILLVVQKPFQDPARDRDHHREHGDDPGGPARSQRVMEQQARRQRNLSKTIHRRVLDNVSPAILGIAHISRPGLQRSHDPHARPSRISWRVSGASSSFLCGARQRSWDQVGSPRGQLAIDSLRNFAFGHFRSTSGLRMSECWDSAEALILRSRRSSQQTLGMSSVRINVHPGDSCSPRCN